MSSALSRELIYALQRHPNRPLANHGRMALMCPTEPKLVEQLRDVISSESNSTEITETGIDEMLEGVNRGEERAEEIYGMAILSNALTATGALGDREKMSKMVCSLLSMLKPGGVVIMREDLGSQPARLIVQLTQFLDLFAAEISGDTTGFQLYSMNQVQDSIHAHSNFLDVYWTLAKQSASGGGGNADVNGGQAAQKLATFREFLDQTQYTQDNVKTYEYIFGENFISPGGLDENRRVLNYLCSPYPGQRMLDIGVGIGGGARQAAVEFGFRVLGCDLSSNMIVHAFERNHRDRDHRVEYQICDAMLYKHEPNSFDVVFSRDCIQHIKDTESLFQNVYTWLRPGGQLLITSYGCGHGHMEPKFLEFVRQRQYHMKSLEELRQFAQQAGFVDIYVENRTERFREILLAERDKVVANKAEFISKFSSALYDKLVTGWADKLQFVADDNHNWLLIRARKPVDPTAWITVAGA